MTKAFAQKYFPWVKLRCDWLDDERIFSQVKTLNMRNDSIISLNSLNPIPRVVRKISKIALIIAMIAIALVFISAQDYFGEPQSWGSVWNFVGAEAFIVLIAIISLFYFFNARRLRAVFFYQDGKTFAFSFLQNETDEFKQFKEQLMLKCQQAVVRSDQRDMELIKSQIPKLQQQGIISANFVSILNERILVLESEAEL